jgi:hypothetical protein
MKRKSFRTLLCLALAVLLLLSTLVGCSNEKKPPESPTEPGETVTPIGDRSYNEWIDENGNSLGPFYVIHADLVEIAKDYERSWYICEFDGYRVKIDEPLPQEFSCSDLNLEITYSVRDLSVSEDGEMYVIAKPMSVRETPTWYDSEITYDKPVIYLYPEVPTTVDVRVNFKGEFTVTIPEYRDGWTVMAHPDGRLITVDGEEYPYLFWEGVPASDVLTLTEGFCVRGEDTEAFLLDVLPKLGLIESEYAEFIDFWLPRMEGNAYNLIRFNDPAYMEMAHMDISPVPDTIIRVFMSYTASDTYVVLPAQHFATPQRNGFAVVEWGGCEIK